MTKLYAHRGLSDVYPENSYMAIKEVLKYNYIYGIEIDIRMTKDNKFVVLHDEDITLVSNGTGNVWDFTLDELYEYDFCSNSMEIKKEYLTSFFKKDGTKIRKRLKKLKDEKSKILTLETVLMLIRDKQLLIEIKYEKNHFNLDKFYKLIKKYNNKNISIQSFDKDVIKYLKNLDSTLDVGILTSGINVENKLSQNINFISIDKFTVTNDIVNNVIHDKKGINIWTINNYKDIKNIKKKLKNNINNVNLICNNIDIIKKYIDSE